MQKKSFTKFGDFKNNDYLCSVLIPKHSLECGANEGGDLYIGKALSDALFLTTRNLAVPYNQSGDKATMTLMGM